MDLNKLHDAWLEAGQKVTDLQEKRNQMAVELNDSPEKYSDEDLTKIADSIDKAKKTRDFAKGAYDDALATAKLVKPDKPAAGGQKDVTPKDKPKFINIVKGALKGDPKFLNLMSSGLDANGNGVGLTIPEDVQTAINTLKQTFTSLEPLVTVEGVSAPSGSRVIEPRQSVTPFANLDDETAQIGNNDEPASFKPLTYKIHRYEGISSITNTLMNDSDANLLAYLENWIAKKDVITRNSEILKALAKLPTTQKTTVDSFDAIKDIYNKELDPLIWNESAFITNQSGFAVLDKVKDNNGQYVIQPNPLNPSQKMLAGKTITVIADAFLPNDGNSFPLYIGALTEAVRLFDLQQMSLLATNIGAGSFESDLTKIRAIDRFDVELWDTESVIYAPFTGLADLTPAAKTSGTTSSTGK